MLTNLEITKGEIMAYQYSVLNLEESNMAKSLISAPASELVKRYIRKKNDKPVKFFDSVKYEVNKVDADEYLVNPYLYLMEGANLNYIATQVFIPASQLVKMGYEFKIDNVMRDLDKLFEEFHPIVNKMSKSQIVQPLSKDIAYFFINQILTNKVIFALENTKGSNFNAN